MIDLVCVAGQEVLTGQTERRVLQRDHIIGRSSALQLGDDMSLTLYIFFHLPV